MSTIEGLKITKVIGLLRPVHPGIVHIRNQGSGVLLGRIHVGALVDARQEGAAPVAGSAHRHPPGTEGYKTREVFILAAHAPGQPGTETGPDQALSSGIHQHQGKLMTRQFGIHGSNHRQLVDTAGEMREKITDRDTTNPMLGE